MALVNTGICSENSIVRIFKWVFAVREVGEDLTEQFLLFCAADHLPDTAKSRTQGSTDGNGWFSASRQSSMGGTDFCGFSHISRYGFSCG